MDGKSKGESKGEPKVESMVETKVESKGESKVEEKVGTSDLLNQVRNHVAVTNTVKVIMAATTNRVNAASGSEASQDPSLDNTKNKRAEPTLNSAQNFESTKTEDKKDENDQSTPNDKEIDKGDVDLWKKIRRQIAVNCAIKSILTAKHRRQEELAAKVVDQFKFKRKDNAASKIVSALRRYITTKRSIDAMGSQPSQLLRGSSSYSMVKTNFWVFF